MTKKLLLCLLLICVSFNIGCGGGGGSKNPPAILLGTIQGTVTFESDTTSSSSFININSSVDSTNFSKISVRQSHYAKQSVANEKIVKLRPGLSATEAAKVIASLGGTIKKKLYGTEATYLITINDQTFSNSAAEQNSNIEYIEDNQKFRAFAEPNDPLFTSPYYWNYRMFNLSLAWDEQDVKNKTSDIIVAVLDTGISKNHPDLADNLKLVSGADCVNGDDDPSDTAREFSHGTHVAGTISAVTNNGIGIAGVAWNVKIMPIRVLDSNGEGDPYDVIEGIDKAVTNGAKVINLSLGMTNVTPDDPRKFIQDIKTAIDNAIGAGVTVVAAAGNENGPVAFPANYYKVIAVSAIDHTGTKASYSNYGSEIDFCAPGGGEPLTQNESEWAIKTILSTGFGENGYAYMAGTSMATPHISGLAALLYAIGETDPTNIKQRLIDGCIDLGNPNYYGNGLPDAYAVLSNSAPKMAKVKIFIGNPDGTIISNLQHVGASGDYTLFGIKGGTYYICAFDDTDGDNIVDRGVEKFSYKQITLTNNTTLTGVNITLPN